MEDPKGWGVLVVAALVPLIIAWVLDLVFYRADGGSKDQPHYFRKSLCGGVAAGVLLWTALHERAISDAHFMHLMVAAFLWFPGYCLGEAVFKAVLRKRHQRRKQHHQ